MRGSHLSHIHEPLKKYKIGIPMTCTVDLNSFFCILKLLTINLLQNAQHKILVQNFFSIFLVHTLLKKNFQLIHLIIIKLFITNSILLYKRIIILISFQRFGQISLSDLPSLYAVLYQILPLI